MWWAMWSEGEGVWVGGALWGWGTRGLQMQLQLQVRLQQKHMHLPAVAGLCSLCPYFCVEASRCHTCIDDDPPRSETAADEIRCTLFSCDPISRVSKREEMRRQQTACFGGR